MYSPPFLPRFIFVYDGMTHLRFLASLCEHAMIFHVRKRISSLPIHLTGSFILIPFW